MRKSEPSYRQTERRRIAVRHSKIRRVAYKLARYHGAGHNQARRIANSTFGAIPV